MPTAFSVACAAPAAARLSAIISHETCVSRHDTATVASARPPRASVARAPAGAPSRAAAFLAGRCWWTGSRPLRCAQPAATPAALPAAAPVAAALTPLFAENAVEEFLLSHPDLVDNVSGAFYIVFLSACLIAFFVADAKQQEKNRRGK